MKITALASCMLLLLLVSVFQSFSLAKANPVPYPTEPNQELPTLEVDSPKNGEFFAVATVSLNFTVTKPDSWNHYWMFGFPVIGSYVVEVYLDGNPHSTCNDPGSSGFPTADYSVFLYRLTRGTHSVKIEVEAFAYYDDPANPEPGRYLTYSRSITETIRFTVDASKQIMSFKDAVQAANTSGHNGSDGIGSYRWYGDVNSSLYENESGVYGYLMWLSPDGWFYEAEYPTGNTFDLIGDSLSKKSGWNPPDGYYIWSLHYADGEEYWILANNGTILLYNPPKMEPTSPPTQPSIPYELIYGMVLPTVGIVICLGLLVYFKKRQRDKNQ
jgi:hypothetical protein